MPIFRKRPVEVEAEQFLVGKPLPFANAGPYVMFDGEFYVITVHGQRTPIAVGDWIILETHGVPGQFQSYPCKPDVFEASYELATPVPAVDPDHIHRQTFPPLKGGFETKSDVYQDEQYLRDQASKPMRFILASEIDLSEDRDPQVIPHNTMRFDVHMAHVYGIFEDGDITKEQVAQIISDAIIQAVNVAIGPGLDGVPIPGGIDRDIHPKSLMLHRETLSCDLS